MGERKKIDNQKKKITKVSEKTVEKLGKLEESDDQTE